MKIESYILVAFTGLSKTQSDYSWRKATTEVTSAVFVKCPNEHTHMQTHPTGTWMGAEWRAEHGGFSKALASALLD